MRFLRVALFAPLLLMSACQEFEEQPLPPQPVPFEAASPPPVAPPTSPNQVANAIIHYFTSAGYQRFQAEALADHARVESGFRPCAAGPGGYRYSFQWSGLRLQRLHEFAGGPGCPSLDVQLAFTNNELRGNPNFSCFWQATDRASALRALRRGFGQGRC